MRAMRIGIGSAFLSAAAMIGCDTYFFMGGDPVWLAQVCEDGTLDCFATGTTTSSGCDGDPTLDASVVTDDCGVFVKPGATGGDGTMGAPFGSFVEAAKADAAWIFACEGEYAETEGVVIGGDISIYGGFTGCLKEWTWSAEARARILGPADAIALTLVGGTSHIENVDVIAADAVADGGSSIAVLVNGGVVEIENGDLTSGDAKAGAAGESLGDAAPSGDPGEAGGGICASGITNPGAKGTTKTCPDGSESSGGDGGDGGEFVSMVAQAAGNGADGSPAPDPNPGMKGIGGKGEPVGAGMQCDDGESGIIGGPGGPAVPVSGLGDIGEAGYQGVSGKPGEYGKPGQGGGGGGGAKGALQVQCGAVTADRVGASGGAGGTGGCGGKGGGGGGAGGASIVLVSLSGDVTLTNVNLRPGAAGNGGAGGVGQSKGLGASGGDKGDGAGDANSSCAGGGGGDGGKGGAGSGGTGGHAIGIAFKGAAPNKGGTIVMDKAVPGAGGDGGVGNELPGKGGGGVVCPMLSFDKDTGECEP